MTDSPLGPLSRIGKRLRKITGDVGLEMREFHLRPDLDDESGPHYAQALFTLKEDFTPEPPKDDEWEAFEQAQYEHAQREREEKAREELAQLAKNLEGDRDQGIL